MRTLSFLLLLLLLQKIRQGKSRKNSSVTRISLSALTSWTPRQEGNSSSTQRNPISVSFKLSRQTKPLYEHARSSTLHFDRFAIAVYNLTHCPNYRYDGGRLPEAFEAGQVDRVVSKISRYLKTIDKDSPQYASFATKQHALVTLRQMCRDIYDANTPVAKEVIASFNEDFSPANLTWKIVAGFTKEEIRLLKSRAIGKKWLLETNGSESFRRLNWVVARVGGANYYWQYELERQKRQKERARLRKRSRFSD